MGEAAGFHARSRGPEREDRIMISHHVLVAVPEATVLAYEIESLAGNRFIIYSPAVLGDSTDHRPDKWYFSFFPLAPGIAAGEPFDTAADAEEAALLMDAWWG